MFIVKEIKTGNHVAVYGVSEDMNHNIYFLTWNVKEGWWWELSDNYEPLSHIGEGETNA
jgi:hypothetical protein